MPTAFSGAQTPMLPLPVSPRYTRRNAERAMGGFVIRGLVELITNARDSGRRLRLAGLISDADLEVRPVEIEYSVRPDTKRIVVRDRFEGMTAATMMDRLLQYGTAASGFETGAPVRGINARGAKDVGSLGDVRFESIRGDTYAECLIRSGMYVPPVARAVTNADRERLGIPRGNGTVVTLSPLPEVTIPRFDELAVNLERHIELRYHPEGLPVIPIELKEMRRGGREHTLVGFKPEGCLLLDQEIPLPEYSRYGGPARLRLHKSDEELAIVGSRNAVTRFWRSEAGILVADGRTAHDVTFFHARGAEDAAARHLFGDLLLPQVPNLLKEFEEFEERRESDPTTPVNTLNPSQVTDPDRLGLNFDHPFVQAVADQVRPIVEQALLDLQRELTPSAQERVSAELRAALERLGEQLAERFDFAGSGSQDGHEMPLGLRLVPGGFRVEVGKTKRMGVYFKTEAGLPPGNLDVALSASSEAVRLSTNAVTLVAVPEQTGLYRGSFELTGQLLSDLVLIQAAFQGATAAARVTVREPTNGVVELDRDLQFSQRRYTSVPGRRKRVEVFADQTLADQEIELGTVQEAVALSERVVRLGFDRERGVAVGVYHVDSRTPATDVLTVRLGELSDQAQMVFQDFTTRPKLEFLFDDIENFGPGRRFKWDSQRPNAVHIAAKHPTLARVLGPDLGAQGVQWPGQEDPQTRAILAELIAEAYVDRRLNQELPSLGIGAENLVDPVEYESYRYSFFEECFMVCHSLLTPGYEGPRV